MKKTILIAAAIFIFGKANGQENNPVTSSKPKVFRGEKNSRLMVLVGLNYAALTNTNGSSLVNYHGGIANEFILSDKFSIQPELLYAVQGTKLYSGSLYLQYINLPLLAKYYVSKPLSLIAGPQVGFLTAAKGTNGNGQATSISNLVKSVDFSLKFGLGYNIESNATVQLTYGLGLTQIQEQLAPGEEKLKNSVFMFSVGYKF